LNYRFRIGVVGCGRISDRHFSAIEEHKDSLELSAICDTDKHKLDHFSDKYKITGYQSIEAMLDNESLDIVAICTPSGLHPEQTILAANKKVHVITEKPMATRWSDGLKMVQACDKAGVYLFVVKQNRNNSTLQLLKKVVNEKRFGKMNMVHINVFWTRPQEYYDSAKWRGTWELDGGAFMNQASHYVDLIDWLIGPVSDIQAMTGTLMRDIEVEDSGVINIRWRSGALGSMCVTMLTYPKNFEGSITIIGSKGTVRIGGVALNEITHWSFDDKKDYDKSVYDLNYKTSSVYGNGHSLYYKNVVNTLNGVSPPETDGREGLKSLEILIATYLSARDGKVVSLPLEY
jgi:UDP-N-acetyl-2-amino-2-deoxyglucuronate dehydrogenase